MPQQSRRRPRRPPRAGALSDLPPLKILRSILLLQISYYVAAFLLLLFTVLVFGQNFSIALVFDWKVIRGDNTLGWTVGVVWLLVGFVTYVFVVIPPPTFAAVALPRRPTHEQDMCACNTHLLCTV